MSFGTERIDLPPGGIVCVYSDGVTEAQDKDDEFFGDERLIESIRKHRDAPLSDVLAEYRLDQRFPDLAQSPGFTAFGHHTTVTEIWSLATGQRSAAAELYALLDAGADESAIREVLAERAVDRPRFFFLEAEVNAQGYRFLQDGRLEQAIAMFRINVELFPEAWNVYDSLGEALLAKGDVAEAAAMYEKSLVLNPESPSGAAALARIRGTAPTT